MARPSEWLAFDAGIAVAYFIRRHRARRARLWALPAGIARAVAGPAIAATQRRDRQRRHAAGEISRAPAAGRREHRFVRPGGAFALAHAGLCAVVGMAEAAGPAYWPVLVIGNAAIVALEGLVVSIQTTRLILFEFFIRF